MPIYEYLCDSCGNRIEALQKISDEPLKICSACGSTSLRKLVSAASFRLKGKGWYETDFKTGEKKKLAESDSKSEDKSNGQSNEKGTDKAVNKNACVKFNFFSLARFVKKNNTPNITVTRLELTNPPSN